MKKLNKSEALATVKPGIFVYVSLHGNFYGIDFDDIFCLRIRTCSDNDIDFVTLYDELVISFDYYGTDWEIVIPE